MSSSFRFIVDEFTVRFEMLFDDRVTLSLVDEDDNVLDLVFLNTQRWWQARDVWRHHPDYLLCDMGSAEDYKRDKEEQIAIVTRAYYDKKWTELVGENE